MIKKTAAILAAGLAVSATGAGAAQRPSDAPVVVELFSSQACGSCLAAADLFAAIAERDDVVALGWHIDYWNAMPTADGAWADPYSSANHTDRQRRYNVALRDKSTVYTPQMVIDGAVETIGSKTATVLPVINAAKQAKKPIPIDARRTGDRLHFKIGANEGGEAFLVYFRPKVRTQIKAGENAGQHMIERNVVAQVTSLGPVSASGAQLTAAAGELACALIVQKPGQGEIIAAQYCPA